MRSKALESLFFYFILAFSFTKADFPVLNSLKIYISSSFRGRALHSAPDPSIFGLLDYDITKDNHFNKNIVKQNNSLAVTHKREHVLLKEAYKFPKTKDDTNLKKERVIPRKSILRHKSIDLSSSNRHQGFHPYELESTPVAPMDSQPIDMIIQSNGNTNGSPQLTERHHESLTLNTFKNSDSQNNRNVAPPSLLHEHAVQPLSSMLDRVNENTSKKVRHTELQPLRKPSKRKDSTDTLELFDNKSLFNNTIEKFHANLKSQRSDLVYSRDKIDPSALKEFGVRSNSNSPNHLLADKKFIGKSKVRRHARQWNGSGHKIDKVRNRMRLNSKDESQQNKLRRSAGDSVARRSYNLKRRRKYRPQQRSVEFDTHDVNVGRDGTREEVKVRKSHEMLRHNSDLSSLEIPIFVNKTKNATIIDFQSIDRIVSRKKARQPT